MVSISLTTSRLLDTKATAKAILLEHGFEKSALKDATKLFPALPAMIAERKFTGNTLSSLVIPISKSGSLSYLILIGLGKKNANQPLDIESYRRVIGKLMRIMEEY